MLILRSQRRHSTPIQNSWQDFIVLLASPWLQVLLETTLQRNNGNPNGNTATQTESNAYYTFEHTRW
jgi:hypothetical protein